jgi:hypothetical protein
MKLAPRAHETSATSTEGTASIDRISVQKAESCRDAQDQKRKYQSTGFESDHGQVQERWHRDPFGRENKQSVTKAVENQRNLEEAMYNEGFSQVRASKIAYYMTRCEGQFQEWDLIVKKQPRLKNQITKGDDTADLTTKFLEGQLDCALDEDGEEDEINNDDSDRDGSDATSVIGGGSQRLRELKGTVSGRVSLANATSRPRSQKDERRRRRDRKLEALRIKEYAKYTYDDYVQAARRYDIVYGSAEKLYHLAEDQKARRLIQSQTANNQPTTEMMIDGHLVDVEDPTFGLTQPPVEEALTQEERRASDIQNNQLWTEKQREILIRSLERTDVLESNSMSR